MEGLVFWVQGDGGNNDVDNLSAVAFLTAVASAKEVAKEDGDGVGPGDPRCGGRR